jgi:site-specific recombinase XerD
MRAGIDVRTARDWPGHKSIKTTQRYLGVSTQLRREAVNRLKLPGEVTAE